MKIKKLGQYFSRIESTSLRNEKTEILAELINNLADGEMAACLYLSLGRLGPLYDTREFNLAEKMVVRAIAYAYGEKLGEIEKNFKSTGDVGTVVYQLDKGGEGEITIDEAYNQLIAIADQEGSGSQERKVRMLAGLISKVDRESQKFLVRLVAGKLRLGFSDMTVIDALSVAKTGDKRDRKAIEHGFNVRADIAKVAELYLRDGAEAVSSAKINPGIPIRPAKAERVGTIEEIVGKLGEMSVEPKYDGMRVQIHAYRSGDSQKTDLFGHEDGVRVRIFSRGMEDISHMFPDISSSAKEIVQKTGHEFVIDAEAIGVDEEGIFLPFQETIKRKRKHGVGKKSKEIPLKVFAFDVLFMDEDLLDMPYRERRQKLGELLNSSMQIVASEYSVASDPDKIDKILRGYLDEGLEGVMCKKLDSIYQAGARNFNWIKYKKAHEKELADTLDCVVLGSYVGKGKRQKFGLGAFLVGVMKDEKYVTVAKIGTGLSDEQWGEMYERMSKVITPDKPIEYDIAKVLECDQWVLPSIVVEIEADEITKSPTHSAGYALRFPRLIRFRDDKRVEDVNTQTEVEDMYEGK